MPFEIATTKDKALVSCRNCIKMLSTGKEKQIRFYTKNTVDYLEKELAKERTRSENLKGFLKSALGSLEKEREKVRVAEKELTKKKEKIQEIKKELQDIYYDVTCYECGAQEDILKVLHKIGEG